MRPRGWVILIDLFAPGGLVLWLEDAGMLHRHPCGCHLCTGE